MMRKHAVVGVTILCALLLVLSGCKEETPAESEAAPEPVAPVTTPVEPEQLPVITDEDPPTEPEPIPVEVTGDDVVATIVSDFTMLLYAREFPEIAPNSEASIVALREWMQEVNELDTHMQFDTANLGMSEYGYCMNLYSPLDYWGNQICFWVQDTPVGRQFVAVSPGQDGVFTYEGFGPDYSESGFGDDNVRLLEIQL